MNLFDMFESGKKQDIEEACWKGYHKEGMKTMFGKRYPNCVKNKNESLETYVNKGECPGCGGAMVSEEQINEKQDACYHKVKSRYKVWPSAYASGALVQCRKKGAANWGNKNESITQEEYDQLDENLKQWFSDKWVRFGPDGKIRGDCARGDSSEGKPKCLPQSKAHALGKKGRASAAARKRREDPNPERSGKAINVATKKKSNEGMAEGSLAEMDKSAPQPGRDGNVSHKTYGSRDNYKLGDPERTGKQISAKKAKKDALDILKKQGVAEERNKQGYHTRVQKGKFLPSKYGEDQYNYLHDLMNSSYDGEGPVLVTIDDKKIAREIAAMYGGDVEQTGLGTYRIVQRKGAAPIGNKTPELTGVAEGFDDVVKGVKRLVKGKPSKGDVAMKHTLKALGAAQAGDMKTAGKEATRWEKVQNLPKKDVAESSNKKQEATRRIQKMLNDKFGANLDVDGVLGPLTLKSINKFMPNAKVGPAEDPNKTTAVQGKKVKNEDTDQNQLAEKWSQKYKSSINCSDPKGFSQRAHCDGKKKNEDVAETAEYNYNYSNINDDDWYEFDSEGNVVRQSGPRRYELPFGSNKTIKLPNGNIAAKGMTAKRLKLFKNLSESREYYNVTSTDSTSLRQDFNMSKDRFGWYLSEGSTPKHKLDAYRAFGSPKLKEYDLSAFSGGTQTKGEDNVISPVGSQTKSQYKK
jgi:hypothetical protein